MRRVGRIELVEGVLGRDGEQVVGRKMHKRCPHGGARYGEVTRAERVHLVGAVRVGLGLGAACERGAVDHERRSLRLGEGEASLQIDDIEFPVGRHDAISVVVESRADCAAHAPGGAGDPYG